MLTVEIINQNEILNSLTEDQKKVITELSKNDENAVIGSKIGALHGQYDNDIFSITQIKKNDGEKSYDYAKRVLTDYKNKIDSDKVLQSKLDEANIENASLKAKIAEGKGSEVISQQLKDSKAQVSQLQSQLELKTKEFSDEKLKLENKIKDIRVDYEFQSAVSDIKFKPEISENIRRIVLNSAKNEVLAKGIPEFIENGNGGSVLVLRGADGNILNNPKNGLNPYTLKELVMETSLRDAIDPTIVKTGGGTGGKRVKNSLTNIVDISSAKSQIEADNIITKQLLSEGLTRDSEEFQARSLEMRIANKVSELPLRNY